MKVRMREVLKVKRKERYSMITQLKEGTDLDYSMIPGNLLQWHPTLVLLPGKSHGGVAW